MVLPAFDTLVDVVRIDAGESFRALVDVVRMDAGESFGTFPISFLSGVEGLTLIALVKFTLRALRWGRGEIDLLFAGTATSRGARSLGVFTSSVSSSELLNRRRLAVPVCVGDGAFFGFGARADSPSIERGRYFGRPDDTRELRLRVEARELIEALGLALSDGDVDEE